MKTEDTGFRLDGMTVAVIGASGGVGAASAIACAQAGASVILLGRHRGKLDLIAGQITGSGGTPAVHICEVTVKASIDRALGGISSLHALVYCAGVNQPEPFTNVRENTFDHLFAVNVRGAFFAAQAAVSTMNKDGGGGAIIMISSQMGHVGAPLRTVYCATKHAIEGLTKALAIEVAPMNIRVVSIAPTFVHTPMTAAQLDDPVVGPRLREQIPQRRFGTPEEVARAVVYAASPAARMMTGTALMLDGGWTAQ